MKYIKLVSVFLLVTICTYQAHALQDQAPIRWQAELDTGHGPLEFGIEFQSLDHPENAFIINGPERLAVEIAKGETAGQLILRFPHYDSMIVMELSDDQKSLTGKWTKRRGDKEFATMDFSASLVVEKLQTTNGSDEIDDPKSFMGRWQVNFDGDSEQAVAKFKRLGNTNQVSGTFLTTTGDYRYLGGYLADGKLNLSCFDGAHAFLFHAELNSSGMIDGMFYSGNWYKQSWTAVKNAHAKLADATQLTTVSNRATLSELKFPNLVGEETSLNELINGQPAIVEVFGSWCPNCHDAAEYLAELHDEYANDKLKIVGLAFELTSDAERNAEQVKRYIERHEIDYPVLIAGPADKQKATEEFKFLDRIRSYPTFIFVNKQGKVISVYQGFSGPATGDAFAALKEHFESTIKKMIVD